MAGCGCACGWGKGVSSEHSISISNFVSIRTYVRPKVPVEVQPPAKMQTENWKFDGRRMHPDNGRVVGVCGIIPTPRIYDLFPLRNQCARLHHVGRVGCVTIQEEIGIFQPTILALAINYAQHARQKPVWQPVGAGICVALLHVLEDRVRGHHAAQRSTKSASEPARAESRRQVI